MRELIEEWKYFELPEIIDRKINPLLFLSWKVKKIIPFIGFRRVGKTYLLFQVAKKIGKEHTFYLNFEDIRIKDIKFSDFLKILREYYGKKKTVLLLDEIQEIERWDRWLRSLNDIPNIFVYVSGSSSKLGLENIPSRLRGRTFSITIFPLDFEEFLKFKGENPNIPDSIIRNHLNEYLEYGGMPEIVMENSKGKKLLTADEYFNTFVSRDLIEKHKIRNEPAIKFIIRYLLDATQFTHSKLYNTLKSCGYEVGKGTLLEYIDYLKESFLFNFLHIYASAKRKEQYPKKVYTIDNIFLRRFSTKFGTSRLMENLVAIELLRRKAYLNPNLEIFYFRTKEGYEVDFLIKEGLKVRQLIQVSYANSFDEVEEREIRALLHAKELFKQDKPELICITWDYEDEKKLKWFGKEGKVKFLPLWKWLLSYSPK